MFKMNFEGVGVYGVPELKNDTCTVEKFIGFNFAKTSKDFENVGIHFFIDDYQFSRLWERPDDYLNLLKKFGCVLTPDFSTYTDFPKSVQIYNHFRKHWLGAYWQMNGLTVIPTISWSDEDSFQWCFDGEPTGGTVAVSSVGTQKNMESKRLFLQGYEEMLSRLTPETVIFYGDIPIECKGNIVRIKSFQDKFKEAKINGW